MKEQDYLWDKMGADPEIERLEEALLMFRYKETAPPALSAKVLPFAEKIAEKAPRQRFSFAFACVTCAAMVLITFGIFFQLSNSKNAVLGDTAKTTEPQINSDNQNDWSNNKPDALPIEKAEIPIRVEAPKKITKQNVIKIRKNIPADSRLNKTIARNTAVKKPAVKLTQEEKHAYDQLLLALSITSSKLNMVKDKIERAEEQNIVNKNER